MSHAFFIWGAYGVTFVVLALEVVLLARRSKRCKARMPQ
jgi:heme exporter protein CcmD